MYRPSYTEVINSVREHHAWLYQLRHGSKRTACRANFSNMDLRGIDFSSSKFQKVGTLKMDRIDFFGADVEGACFSNCVLDLSILEAKNFALSTYSPCAIMFGPNKYFLVADANDLLLGDVGDVTANLDDMYRLYANLW